MCKFFIQFPPVEPTSICVQLAVSSTGHLWQEKHEIYTLMHADVCWYGFQFGTGADVCGLPVYVY